MACELKEFIISCCVGRPDSHETMTNHVKEIIIKYLTGTQ